MTNKTPPDGPHKGSIAFAVLITGPFGVYKGFEWFDSGFFAALGWIAGAVLGIAIGELWIKGLEPTSKK